MKEDREMMYISLTRKPMDDFMLFESEKAVKHCHSYLAYHENQIPYPFVANNVAWHGPWVSSGDYKVEGIQPKGPSPAMLTHGR